MASWGISYSPQQQPQRNIQYDYDDEDFDASNRSSHLSTPAHETIPEEDDEEDIDEQLARSPHHPFDTRNSAEFSTALQELKSIRSHLYSAADYCESAYIYSGQKQEILENLKDYSVKALVNAVDHVGTVAAKLDDLLSKRTKEMSVLEFNVSCLSKQLQAYRDNATCEGLNHYQSSRRKPRYGRHYALATDYAIDGKSKSAEERWKIVHNTSQPGGPAGHSQADSAPGRANPDSHSPKDLGWHDMAPETPSYSSVRSTPNGPHVSRSTSSNSRGDKKLQGFLTRSMSGGQFSSPRSSPRSSNLDKLQEPGHSPVSSSKTLSSLLSMDEIKHHDVQTHKKGLLSTFLGRTKSTKPKRLSTLTSFR